jgi:hypothetical protein
MINPESFKPCHGSFGRFQGCLMDMPADFFSGALTEVFGKRKKEE